MARVPAPLVPMRNIVPDQPAGGAAYQDVGRKMLLAEDAGDADPGCGGVSGDLGPARRILAGNRCSGGPGDHAMGRWKRRIDAGAGLEEAAAIAVRGSSPLAPEDEFHALFHDDAVNHRFADKETCFAGMRMLLEVTVAIHEDGRGDESSEERVGRVDIGVVEI